MSRTVPISYSCNTMLFILTKWNCKYWNKTLCHNMIIWTNLCYFLDSPVQVQYCMYYTCTVKTISRVIAPRTSLNMFSVQPVQVRYSTYNPWKNIEAMLKYCSSVRWHNCTWIKIDRCTIYIDKMIETQIDWCYIPISISDCIPLDKCLLKFFW